MSKNILIDTFLSVSKTLNFRQAAKELGISQQAVSKNISRLEANLGFTLLDRNTHSVILTEYGKEFLKINKDYSRRLLDLKERFQTNNNTCLIETLGPKEFAPVHDLSSLYITDTDTKLYFQIRKVDPEAAVYHLREKETDMIVLMDDFLPEKNEWETQEVGSLEICLLVAKNNPLYHEGAEYMEFRNEPFIAKTSMNNLFGSTMTFIDKDIASLNLSPSSIIMLTANEKRKDHLAKGSGITLAPLSPKTSPPEGFALIPTGRFARIVCAWNKSSPKVYLKKVADHIQKGFEYGSINPEI